MKIAILAAVGIFGLLLSGCVTDTIPRRYRSSEREFPAMPNASAPYEVWLTTEGTSRWVMFADRIRTTCKHAVVEFKAPGNTRREAIYDLKSTGLFPEYDFPGMIGCTETYSYWLAPGSKVLAVSHYDKKVSVFESDPKIFWPDLKVAPRGRDSIEVRTKTGEVYVISPNEIQKEA